MRHGFCTWLVVAAVCLPAVTSAFAAGLGPVDLPNGYGQLEYVQSSGTEYVNTGVLPDADTTCTFGLAFQGDTKTDSTFLLGSRKAFRDTAFYFSHQKEGEKQNNLVCDGYACSFGNAIRYSLDHRTEYIELSLTAEKEFMLAKNLVEGRQLGDLSTATMSKSTYPIFLFALNNAGTAKDASKMRLYFCNIYSNGTPVRAFVPVRRLSQTGGEPEIGLYDLVEPKFYGANAGQLSPGPAVGIVASNVRFENGILSLRLAREGDLTAADVTLAYGSVIGTRDVNSWEQSQPVTGFGVGESEISIAVADLPQSARYARLFMSDESSSVIELYQFSERYESPALPEPYRAVSYLQSHLNETKPYNEHKNNKYIIDTEYIHKPGTRFECIANVQKAAVGEWAALFGSRNGTTWTAGGGYGFFAIDEKSKGVKNFAPRYNRSGDKVVGEEGSFPYDEKVKVVTETNTAAWYNVSTGTKLGELVTPAEAVDGGVSTTAIFDLNDAHPSWGSANGYTYLHPSGSPAMMKLYSFRIVEEGMVVRDFVPCLNEYGEPGLYEVFTHKFHGGKGKDTYGQVSEYNFDFWTDLPDTFATYTWTGLGANASWTNAANWSCSDAGLSPVPGWSSSVIFPSGDWMVELDHSIGIKALDLSAADVTLRLSAAVPGAKLLVRRDLTFGTVSDAAQQGLWFQGGAIGVDGNLLAASGASELPLHFLIPQGGFAAAPFSVTGSAFTGELRGRVFVEAKSPALRQNVTAVSQLLSSGTDMVEENVTLEPLRNPRPKRTAEFSWVSARQLTVSTEGHTDGFAIIVR